MLYDKFGEPIKSIYEATVGTPNCGSYDDEDYPADYENEEDDPDRESKTLAQWSH
jgi:hypothetical protein